MHKCKLICTLSSSRKWLWHVLFSSLPSQKVDLTVITSTESNAIRIIPKSSAKPVARLEPKCQKLCAFYAENVNNKCAHKEIHHDASYTLYFIQVFFTTENISTKIYRKHYINRISVYNTHLCPAPARKQSFLIFFYIFNTF